MSCGAHVPLAADCAGRKQIDGRKDINADFIAREQPATNYISGYETDNIRKEAEG